MPRAFNYDTVKFTPLSGPVVTMDGITSIRHSTNGTTQAFRGDNDRFPTTRVADYQDPSFAISGGNVQQVAMSLGHGNRGTFTYRILDAVNGSTSGALTITAIGAMITTPNLNSQHGQYASADLTIATTSADGITNPVSYSVT